MTQPRTPVPVAPVSGRQATTREFFAVLFRRKWLIIGLFTVTLTTVLFVAFTTPVMYVSGGRVLVKRGEKESAFSASRQISAQWEEELGSEMEVVKSEPVLSRARAIVAQQNPGTHFRGAGVDVEVKGKSNVLEISYADRDPLVAKRCAAAAIQAYIEFRQSNYSLSYPQRFFDQEMHDVDTQLRQAWEQRKEFASRTGVVDLPQQRQTQLTLLADLTRNRSELAAQIAELRSENRIMRELRARDDMDLPTLGGAFSNEQALVDLKRRIIEQQTKLATLRERYRDDAFEVVSAESTLTTLRELLAKEVDNRIQMSQSTLDAMEDRLRSVDKDIAGVKADLAAMPANEEWLADQDRRIKALSDEYNNLVDKSTQAQITEHTSTPINVLLLSEADNATARNSLDYVRLALAPAFSIVVGVGIAFFVDGLDLTVRTTSHAEEALDLPVLAAVPERRRRRRNAS
jgi:uncharacterized protein involved in exopolysaccharide biosynthesis